jgi:hypothetical protein
MAIEARENPSFLVGIRDQLWHEQHDQWQQNCISLFVFVHDEDKNPDPHTSVGYHKFCHSVPSLDNWNHLPMPFLTVAV